MTRDYKRNGTTSLFAAMNTDTGEVIGQCMKNTDTRSGRASAT